MATRNRQATSRREKPSSRRLGTDLALRRLVGELLARRWSRAQIARHVHARYPQEALFLELLDREARDAGSGDSLLATDATGWALATLDFFLEAVHNPPTRAALGERYRQSRRGAGAAIVRGRPSPHWASWEELASVGMALRSGLIIQSAVDQTAVDPTLIQRGMERMLGDTQE